MEKKKIGAKIGRWLDSAIAMIMPWTLGLSVALAATILTVCTRIHQIAFITSMAYVFIGFVLFVARYIVGNIYNQGRAEKKRSSLSPFKTFLILASMSMFLMFLPMYDTIESGDFWRTFCLSIHNTMRLFVLDGDFQIVHDYLGSSYALCGAWADVFMEYSVFMFILAPIMSAGFVLSFVKDAWAQILSTIRLGKEVYYISELNASSIALARDIKKDKKNALVIFFDVYHEQNEEHHELMERAIRYGAICFRKDISSVGLVRPRKTRKFFFIGENEEENLKQAIDLVNRCNDMLRKSEKAEFYVFATTSDSELLVDALAKNVSNNSDRLKIRRIDVTKNLALHTVEEDYAIFPRANEPKKSVDIVIIGIGAFGKELLKAYCWASQLPNTEATIHLIDKDENLEQRLKLRYPELIEYGNKLIHREGDSNYVIDINGGIDVNYDGFEAKLQEIQEKASGGIDSVFVCLGNDELNVKTAMNVRRIIGRKLDENTDLPIIKSVVFSTRKTDILAKNNDKDIKYIGSMREVYSLKNIESIEKEQDAIRYHMYWAASDLKATFEKINNVLNGDAKKAESSLESRLEGVQSKVEALIKADFDENVKNEIKCFAQKLNTLIKKFEEIRINEENKSQFRLDKMEFSPYEKELFKQVEFIEKDKERIFELTETCKKKQRNEIEAFFKQAIKLANENPVLALIYFKGKAIDYKKRYDLEEYCRHSSVARATYVKISRALGYYMSEIERINGEKSGEGDKKVLLDEEQRQIYEHSRWNAFMRAEGYVFTENRKLKSAKTKMHDLLKIFEKLDDGDKEKDSCYEFLDEINNGENK